MTEQQYFVTYLSNDSRTISTAKTTSNAATAATTTIDTTTHS